MKDSLGKAWTTNRKRKIKLSMDTSIGIDLLVLLFQLTLQKYMNKSRHNEAACVRTRESFY